MLNRKRVLLISLLVVVVIVFVLMIPEKKQHTKSQHFSFIFSNSIDTGEIHDLAADLESNYYNISNDLETIPAENIEVNVYAQRWRYIQVTRHWSASGNIEGISKLHFVQQTWGEADSKKVAVHEFTHAVVLKMLIDNEPQPFDSKAFDKKFAGFPHMALGIGKRL
jgi:hypothetical protein